MLFSCAFDSAAKTANHDDMTHMCRFQRANVEVGDGRSLTMTTKSIQPLIFIFDDFLNELECSSAIDESKEHMKSSGLSMNDADVVRDKTSQSPHLLFFGSPRYLKSILCLQHHCRSIHLIALQAEGAEGGGGHHPWLCTKRGSSSLPTASAY